MTTRTTTSSILCDEHAAITAVLGYLDRAVGALEQAKGVDPAIFGDLLEFFTLFVGQCHHGKEEQLLFPTLRRSSEMAVLIAELEREHGQGMALVDAYAAAVKGYAERGLQASGPLIAAARAYAAFLGRHIERENESLLPGASRLESPAEQADLVAAFERYEDDVMGTGTHERLHRMIDTLGPRLASYDA